MNKKIIIIILLLLVSIFFVINNVNNQKKIPSEQPKYRTIEKKEFILGKFWPIEEVKIKSEISGIIENIYIKIGDSVKIGSQIAKLRIIPNPENLEITKKSMTIAKVNLKQNQVNYERNKKLFDKGVIAKIEYEKVTQDLKNAKIEYEFSKKNYNIALKGFSTKKESRNVIKSTIEGRILDIPIKKGMNITERNNFNEGNTIAVIANTSKFVFEFDIGETIINSIKVNDEFNISIKALKGENVRAKIIELRPASQEKNVAFSYKVKAELKENKLSILSGFSGLAEFILFSKDSALTIKEKNIIYKGRKSFVEIIDNSEQIKEVEIKRGLSNGVFTEILSGIEKNSRIKIQ